MRTLALLLILVAKVVSFSRTIASSQPYQWLVMVGQALASVARYLGC